MKSVYLEKLKKTWTDSVTIERERLLDEIQFRNCPL
jgi:hypothetical protein